MILLYDVVEEYNVEPLEWVGTVILVDSKHATVENPEAKQMPLWSIEMAIRQWGEVVEAGKGLEVSEWFFMINVHVLGPG